MPSFTTPCIALTGPSLPAPGRDAYRFVHRLSVPWAGVGMPPIASDAYGLRCFDAAQGAYWRALALPWEQAMCALGGDLHLRKATLEFHGSARTDEPLDAGLKCGQVHDSALRFAGSLFQQDQGLVHGEFIHVFADRVTQAPQPLPQALRDVLCAFESGAAMTELALGDWTTLGAAAGALRQQVFIDEQGVPQALEWDEHDAVSVHAVVHNRLGQSIATGRLLPAHGGVARIGRVAVHPALRGAGHGAVVMRALEDAARRRGDAAVHLHAQCSAERFYARLGYTVAGAPFEEAGIAHIDMRRPLSC